MARLVDHLQGWSELGHGTLAQRLARALRDAIAHGTLADGDRLPAERTLAAALAVSRATVTTALDDLRSEGLVVSRQGSGSVVRSRTDRAIVGTRIADHFTATGAIDLVTGNPYDASHLPPVTVDVATLLAHGGGPNVEPLGLVAFRQALADWHTERGQFTQIDQIHVTSGAHHAVSVSLNALAGPGVPVAVESPSYPGVFDVIEQIGAVPVTVRSDLHGLVPEHLDAVLAERRPPVAYVQSGPHNPTGRVPTPQRQRELAEVFDRNNTVVLEDVTLADLTFAGRLRPELVDLCRRATVVSLGSFSKTAWAGLRIGWLRAPAPFVARTTYLALSLLGPAVPSQLLALQLMPHLPDIAAARRALLFQNVERGVEHLARELPDWSVVPPEGGSVLWVELPIPDTGAFVALAGRHGVHVAPGSVATPDRGPDPHVRICVDRPWSLVEAGIERLRAAWVELQATGSRAGPRRASG